MIAAAAFAISIILSSALIGPVGGGVNNMFTESNEKQEYTATLDESMFIDIDLNSSKVEIDYSAENGFAASAGVGFAVILVPVLLSTVSILKMKPKDILTD